MQEEEIRKRDLLDRYLELVDRDIEVLFSDRSRFTKRPCPACGGTQVLGRFQKRGFQYVTCSSCETLFVNPAPPKETLAAFYTSAPSSLFWINDFFKPVAAARQEKIFRPRAQFIAKTFGLADGWKVGDIGSGFGLFLEELKKIWPRSEMIAIEPSPDQAALCESKGFKVVNKLFEDIEFQKPAFDLLVSFELIEHVLDPSLFIRQAFRALKSGGWLYLTTLNGLGFDILLLGEKAKAVHPPHHLNFLNPSSIRHLLETGGFTVVEVATPGELDVDIVEGMILRDGVDLGPFWNQVSTKVGPEGKKGLQQWIKNNLLSSHMSVLAKKA